MTRQIVLDFAGFTTPITADLLDADEPEFSEMLWTDLAEPVKMWTWHTTSSGDWFGAKGRPAPHPRATGTQAKPVGRARLMCDVEVGSIIYSGGVLTFAYGRDVTEPLPCFGPVVARATDLDAFYDAGRHVWDSHYGTHELVTLTAKRSI